MYRTSNPVLTDNTFVVGGDFETHEHMTLEGVASKTAFMTSLIALMAFGVYNLNDPYLVMGSLIVGAIGGLITVLVVVFSGKCTSNHVAVYAILEGLFLGGLSTLAEAAYPGVAILAVAITLSIFTGMLLIYRLRLIAYTENFRIALASAVIGIVMIYLISMILLMFGIPVPMIHGSGPIGIAFSVFVIAIASLCLVADFDFIENGVERKAPKVLEWRAVFGLLVTLIWIYIEVLRLLMKLQNRR